MKKEENDQEKNEKAVKKTETIVDSILTVGDSINSSFGQLPLTFVACLGPVGSLAGTVPGILANLVRSFLPQDKVGKYEYEKDLVNFTNNVIRILKGSYGKGYLKERGNDKQIHALTHAKRTNNVDQSIEKAVNELSKLLTEKEKTEINQEFVTAIKNCLYLYPALNGRIALERTIMLARELKQYIGNEFLNKLYVRYDQDGMVRAFYHLFRPIGLDSDMVNCLALVMDEYNKAYARYNSAPVAEIPENVAEQLITVMMSDELKKIRLGYNVNKNVTLIGVFLEFINADCLFFQEQYEQAAEAYRTLLGHITELCAQEQMYKEYYHDIWAYLKNSIGWSLYRNHSKKEAIMEFKELFEKVNENCPFIWRYRRNYGVCLENTDEQYKAAVEQYEKTIKANPPMETEYKIYSTYCSAEMKLWDQKSYKKTDPKSWVQNAKALRESGDPEFCDRIIANLHTYLEILALKNPTFVDRFIQEAKMTTYEIMWSDSEADRQALIAKARQQLKIAETIGPKQVGRLYVERDFNYALYVLTKRNNEKDAKARFEDAKKANAILIAMGKDNEETRSFAKVLSEEE